MTKVTSSLQILDLPKRLIRGHTLYVVNNEMEVKWRLINTCIMQKSTHGAALVMLSYFNRNTRLLGAGSDSRKRAWKTCRLVGGARMIYFPSLCSYAHKKQLPISFLLFFCKKKKVHFKLLFVMAFEAGVHVVKRLQCATNLNRKC